MADKRPGPPTTMTDMLGERPGQGRAMRADGRRNRERVTEVALTRSPGRALGLRSRDRQAGGVGTGTVSRHFPTKELLFEAAFMSRVERLDGIGQSLLASSGPEEAFCAYFAEIVTEGTTNKGLAEALTGAGYDLGAACSQGRHDIMDVMGQLLARAQKAGAVHDDVEADDVNAVITGCAARDAVALGRMISTARTG